LRTALHPGLWILVVALLELPSCSLQTYSGSDTVDLLKRIDLGKDAVGGKWRFDGETLLTPAVRFGRIQIPYRPPEEYDVTLVAERLEGANSIVLGLVEGERQFALVIDAYDHDSASGLDQIDHRPFPETETAFKGRILTNGKPSTIRVAVRRTWLQVKVDEKSIIEWKADYERVSLFPDWRVPLGKALFLGAWTAPYRIHSLTLSPLSGPGVPLR
jgi:hypothetical protein